ncbi:MAG: TonB-dependent receptor [Bacteroidetes bacterium]|nr:TonB-dependent receptor [Bacteroidota bacterium]MBK9798574.1 TonB-dependent receptor [Bacteroidota bacterium]
MKFRYLLFLFILMMQQVVAHSQPLNAGQQRAKGIMIGRFSGKVKDDTSNEALEYVSVQLWHMKFDSISKQMKPALAGGMLTDRMGEFYIENLSLNEQYTLKISSMGYIPYEQKIKFDIDLKSANDRSKIAEKADKDLGNIRLKQNTELLKEVTIEAEKSLYVMKVDRKVFNVDKNAVSEGGSAQDVMKTIPAVQVDIDGNVTLRNSTPQLFIDGKPTTLTLDQIPADEIQSVEIITNPSSKFDAGDSNSGILNLVLKKNRKPGYNGSIRAATGNLLKYMIGGDLNVKEGKLNFFLSGNLVKRSIQSYTTTARTSSEQRELQILQQSVTKQQNQFNHGRIGIDYLVNNRNTLTFAQTLVQGKMKPSDFTVNDSSQAASVFSYYTRSSNSMNQFLNYGTQLSFKHLFPKAGEEFTIDLNYNSPTNSNNANYTTQSYFANGILNGPSVLQKTEGGGYNHYFVGQFDFANPLTENSKFETGARMSSRDFKNETNNYFYIDSLADYVLFTNNSSKYKFTDRVYAVYGTYSDHLSKLLYQVGMRFESSDYLGTIINQNSTFHIQYPFSFFPSAYLTYKLPKNQDLQLNYSRKINRPNFFQLMPFADFTDPQNINIGNAGLTPEFINTIDLDYQKLTEKGSSFLASVYYKHIDNLITRYQYRDIGANGIDSVIFNSYQNSSYSQSYGLELTLRTSPVKWWEITSNLNFYNAQINGSNLANDLITEQLSWFAKMNWNFTLPKNVSIQLSGDYQSRTVLPVGGSSAGNTLGGIPGRGPGGGGMGGGMRDQQVSSSQGYVNENYGMDAAIKWDFIKNVASVSFNVSDVFKTKRYNSYSETPYFTQEYNRYRDRQNFRINLSYRFGKMDASLFKRKNAASELDPMQ